jgi:uncharacterized membrane protein (UPF0127 family)
MNNFEGYKTVKVPIGGNMRTLYVADDQEKRVKGLSEIRYMPRNMGMLFTYDEPVCNAFTMEKTNIPLRIIFIDEDFNVVKSVLAEAGQKEEVRPESDFKYVIELPV